MSDAQPRRPGSPSRRNVSQLPTAAAKKRGAPVGNTNALKHGFYAKAFREAEQSDLTGVDPASLEHEIELLRVFIRRTAIQAANVTDLQESLMLLNVMSKASLSLAALMRTQHAAVVAIAHTQFQQLIAESKAEFRKANALTNRLAVELAALETAYDAAQAATAQQFPTSSPSAEPGAIDPVILSGNPLLCEGRGGFAPRAPEGEETRPLSAGISQAIDPDLLSGSPLLCEGNPLPNCDPQSKEPEPLTNSPVALEPEPVPTPLPAVADEPASTPPASIAAPSTTAPDTEEYQDASNEEDESDEPDDDEEADDEYDEAVEDDLEYCKIPFDCIPCPERPICDSCPASLRHPLALTLDVTAGVAVPATIAEPAMPDTPSQ